MTDPAPLRSGWREGKASRGSGPVAGWGIGLSVTATIVLAGLASGWPILIVPGIAAWFGAMGAATAVADRVRIRKGRRVALALDGDEGEAAVAVRYSLPSGSPALGRDDGLIVVEDGWLVFRGERTEWAVRRTDVIPLQVGEGFAYRGTTGKTLLVTLEPLGDPYFVGRLVMAWRVEETIDGRPVLPPGTVAPERRRWRAPGRAVAGAALALLVTVAEPLDGWIAGSAIGLVVAAAFVPVLVWRTFARHRLARAGAWDPPDGDTAPDR